MANPLNPREYDVVELREALSECETGAGGCGSDEIGHDQSHCQRNTAPHSEQDTADRWVSAIDIKFKRELEADSNHQVDELSESVSQKGLDSHGSATDGGTRAHRGGASYAGERPSVGGNLGTERVDCGRVQANSPTHRESCEEDLGGRHCCGQNPHEPICLERVPNCYSAQMEALAWLESLVSVCGHDKTIEALQYYESIGWLSRACCEQLIDLAAGFAAMDSENQRPLTITEHRESLRYIKILVDHP